RISSSMIGMESARSYSSVTVRTARTYAGRPKSMTTGGGNGFLGSFWGMEGEAEDADKSSNAQTTLQDVSLHFRNLSNTGRVTASREEKDARETVRQQCMKFLMYLLFGDRHKRELDEFWGTGTNSSQTLSDTQSYGITNTYYHSETETTSFATTGVVKTADGREINFGLNLEMSRSFTEYYEESYDIGQLHYTDPLVINLDSNIAELSDQTFFFDLDCDGTKEEISTLGSGSGYLALDLNQDGVINDGSELFGTKSGNGFADLAKYDADGNGWIDEGDDIWDKLLIWTKDEDGNDKLYHLSEAGVGAICLQNARTEFAVNSMKDNHTNGVIRNTGIFLYENGGVGTVQHLDLVR
ncbi:MAG: hypothetical protein NC407_13795, partial [Lachnoclostridium sp.]|nr:hypothetical protein [Lachnoclostridium sp.]